MEIKAWPEDMSSCFLFSSQITKQTGPGEGETGGGGALERGDKSFVVSAESSVLVPHAKAWRTWAGKECRGVGRGG